MYYSQTRKLHKNTLARKISELQVLGEGLGAEIGAAVSIELAGKQYTPLHRLQGNITVLLDSVAELQMLLL